MKISNSKLLRVGHRGAAAYCPHNTELSFRRALEIGVDLIETDVRQCASGELALAHDEHLEGVDGKRLEVAGSSLAELRKVDLGDGQQLLILQDLLLLCQGRCGVMLDLKGEGYEAAMVEAIRASGFDTNSVVIPGGSFQSRERLRELAPEITLSLSLDSFPVDVSSESFLVSIDTPAVTWHYSLLTRPWMEELHGRGKTIYAWTVDEADQMRRLVADGVDGIITNRPDVLNGVGIESQGWGG